MDLVTPFERHIEGSNVYGPQRPHKHKYSPGFNSKAQDTGDFKGIDPGVYVVFGVPKLASLGDFLISRSYLPLWGGPAVPHLHPLRGAPPKEELPTQLALLQ